MTTFRGAIDYGYSGGKLALIDGRGGLRTATVAAIVGRGATDLGMLSIGDVGRQRRRALPDRVAFDSTSYLVGEGVERYAEPMDSMDFLRLRGGPQVQALFYDTLHQALGAGSYAMSLLVGLPIAVIIEEKLARRTLKALREWMVGVHRYSVNDEAMEVRVEHVSVMAQPVGALFAWGLDNAGRWKQKRDDLYAPIGVVDIGLNTVDLLALQGKEVTRRYTGGDKLGMRRAAEYLMEAVRDVHGMDLSLYQADALVRSDGPALYTARGRVELGAMVDEALDRAASDILDFVERKWGSGLQFAYLLLTGGGAEALSRQLGEAFPNATILPRPVTANAVGLARYAQRVFE